ncbi:VOC family protein [Ktedonospora formicarum]|uniref:VOC domain-containing protein n=1 Tax=Ktedonospora formicarum TaxID=2778364 RepID=A0A8J3IC76_9CHLR|nr:VOC family protein [Ktedonospora formicarum]GHO49429.1 hypothetical protein KSX_75920 [Ktedonospora formicarum]
MKNNQIAMANAHLDVNALVEEGIQQNRTWKGLPVGTTLGHMHLRVGDIPQAQAFYHDVLGFDIMQNWNGAALFVSAGGYHHHLGLNTWESRNAPPPPANAVGLRFYTIQLPDSTEVEHVHARLQAAGHPVQKLDEHTLSLRDPWQNGILITSKNLNTLDAVQAPL